MSPRVDVNVQPWESLQARYADAIRDVYDQSAIVEGRVEPPSGRAQHVFDTPDGVRLIVSRERVSNGMTVIHISASRFKGTWAPVVPILCAEVATAFAKVAKVRSAEMRFLGMSEGGIPHFYIPSPTETVH